MKNTQPLRQCNPMVFSTSGHQLDSPLRPVATGIASSSPAKIATSLSFPLALNRQGETTFGEELDEIDLELGESTRRTYTPNRS